MTGKQFKARREMIGWSRSDLATRLQCDEGTLRSMEADIRQVPECIDIWITTIAAVVKALRPPEPAAWMTRPPRITRNGRLQK